MNFFETGCIYSDIVLDILCSTNNSSLYLFQAVTPKARRSAIDKLYIFICDVWC